MGKGTGQNSKRKHIWKHKQSFFNDIVFSTPSKQRFRLAALIGRILARPYSGKVRGDSEGNCREDKALVLVSSRALILGFNFKRSVTCPHSCSIRSPQNATVFLHWLLASPTHPDPLNQEISCWISFLCCALFAFEGQRSKPSEFRMWGCGMFLANLLLSLVDILLLFFQAFVFESFEFEGLECLPYIVGGCKRIWISAPPSSARAGWSIGWGMDIDDVVMTLDPTTTTTTAAKSGLRQGGWGCSRTSGLWLV